MRFAANGVLSVVEQQWISFFRVPKAEQLRRGSAPTRLGRLLATPTDQVVFLGDDSVFDASVAPEQLASFLRCSVGAEEVPFELCAEAFWEPGSAARRLLHE